MFTGIVETTGKVLSFSRRRGSSRLVVRPRKKLSPLKKGQSIAVNGACLTLVDSKAGALGFDVVPETLRLTNPGAIQNGDAVNLERAMKLGARVDGHFVLGHVEGRGRIRAVRRGRGGLEYVIAAPKRLASRIFKKGSVAVDGVSLTVAKAGGASFTVCLIPHTHRATTFAFKKAGDAVNLETDMLAKRRGARTAPR